MFLKIIILLVLLACIGPFFIKGADGQPLLTLDDFLDDAPDVLEMVAPTTEQAQSTLITVYKWQDENGTWHFSDKPVDVEGIETIELDSRITLVASETGELAAKASEGSQSMMAKGIASLPEGVTSLSPEQLQEMMQVVESLQQTVDDRKSQVDEAIGNK